MFLEYFFLSSPGKKKHGVHLDNTWTTPSQSVRGCFVAAVITSGIKRNHVQSSANFPAMTRHSKIETLKQSHHLRPKFMLSVRGGIYLFKEIIASISIVSGAPRQASLAGCHQGHHHQDMGKKNGANSYVIFGYCYCCLVIVIWTLNAFMLSR